MNKTYLILPILFFSVFLFNVSDTFAIKSVESSGEFIDGNARGIDNINDEVPPPVTEDERWGDRLGPDHIPAPATSKLDDGHQKQRELPREPGTPPADGYTDLARTYHEDSDHEDNKGALAAAAFLLEDAISNNPLPTMELETGVPDDDASIMDHLDQDGVFPGATTPTGNGSSE